MSSSQTCLKFCRDFPKVFLCLREDTNIWNQALLLRNTNPDPLKYKGAGLVCYSDPTYKAGGCNVIIIFFILNYSNKSLKFNLNEGLS